MTIKERLIVGLLIILLGLFNSFSIRPNEAQAGIGSDVDKIIALLTQIEVSVRPTNRCGCVEELVKCSENEKSLTNGLSYWMEKASKCSTNENK